MPTVTRRLLVLNLILFVLQMLHGDGVIARFALWPLGDFPAPEVGFPVGFEPWQVCRLANGCTIWIPLPSDHG